jgi:malonate-semialdehyde dehydrogenase (acetylating)/methylmalonate-semialdehyde dehydrogenase
MANAALRNFIAGEWMAAEASETLPVRNPATGEMLGQVPLSSAEDAGRAVAAAAAAFPDWRHTPAVDRVQYLFKLKALMEDHFEDLARSITLENGKTLAESRGEMRRAIENVEVACGIPLLMQGSFAEDIARGIDEFMIRQPLGVSAIICPFNFPGMIPFWFLPYSLACGNTAVVKPSEKVPRTMRMIFELLEAVKFPTGVVNLLNGAREAVDALLEHPIVRTVSFVGSTPVARHIYATGAAHGKRVQCQGGAKNPIVIMPDADMEMTVRIAADSAFGNAGQRCLAASLAITVGEADASFGEAIAETAASRRVGYGLDDGVEMGPVITMESKARIEGLIGRGVEEGAQLAVDGRDASIPGYEKGSFVRPTVLRKIMPGGEVFRTEIFGPVLGLMPVSDLDQAIERVNSGSYGNMACIFTSDGAAARAFRNGVEAGNIGVNIGVAAPMAFFPFSGWKDSFLGDLHGQSRHAVEFFTQTKVVVERWPEEWSRTF